MDQLYKELKEKEKMLENLEKQIAKNIKKVPEGRIRITNKGERIFYYHCTKQDKGKAGRYIHKDEIQLAYDIVQQEYNCKLLKKTHECHDNIKKLLRIYQENELENIYDKMGKLRKRLVTPWVITDEEYGKRWQEKQFEGKKMMDNVSEIYTEKGERVRSKSEKIIADMLYHANVPYRYECPIILKGIGTIHPDFTVLNVKTRDEIYWEHMGMMDSAEYCENALNRIGIYEKNGFLPGKNLIITHETSKKPLDTEIVRNLILSIK